MRIDIASDHAGFDLKQHIKQYLENTGAQVIDFGCDNHKSTDYPLVIAPAAHSVAQGETQRGIFVCGSGVGVAIVANKIEGIRAVNAHDPAEAALARMHNDVNVLTLSGKKLTLDQTDQILKIFLDTDFEGGRHQRRVDQITAIEKGNNE